MPILQITTAKGLTTLPLSERDVVLGRYPFCDVVLPVQSVSRQHTRISKGTDGYYVEDLGSQNGTFVNGRRISSRTKLAHGDRVHVYEVPLLFYEQPPTESESTLEASTPSREEKKSQIIGRLKAAQIEDVAIAAEAKLHAIIELNRQLGSTLEVNHLLPKILDSLFVAFPQADRGFIMMPTGTDDTLGVSQIKDRDVESGEAPTLGPITQSVARQVMKEGQAILMKDLPSEDGDESVFDAPPRSVVCAPLMGPSQKPCGIIHLISHDAEHPFDNDDLQVLASVATVAGQAIELARHHEDLVKLHEEQEATIRKHAQDMERYADDLEQFAFVASHDLRTPLRAVVGCCELLSRKYGEHLDGETKELIVEAVASAGNMKQMLDGLLAFVNVRRSGAGLSAIDVGPVVTAVLDGVAAAIASTGALVDVGDMPCVLADEKQIGELFRQLLDNALKFRGSSPPQIQITAREMGDKWLFAVRDNGIGIDPQYFDRAFVLFQRLNCREAYRGAGAGLTLCKRIVERHGGQISLKSKLGAGCTVYFTLPAAPRVSICE